MNIKVFSFVLMHVIVFFHLFFVDGSQIKKKIKKNSSAPHKILSKNNSQNNKRRDEEKIRLERRAERNKNIKNNTNKKKAAVGRGKAKRKTTVSLKKNDSKNDIKNNKQSDDGNNIVGGEDTVIKDTITADKPKEVINDSIESNDEIKKQIENNSYFQKISASLSDATRMQLLGWAVSLALGGTTIMFAIKAAYNKLIKPKEMVNEGENKNNDEIKENPNEINNNEGPIVENNNKKEAILQNMGDQPNNDKNKNDEKNENGKIPEKVNGSESIIIDNKLLPDKDGDIFYDANNDIGPIIQKTEPKIEQPTVEQRGIIKKATDNIKDAGNFVANKSFDAAKAIAGGVLNAKDKLAYMIWGEKKEVIPIDKGKDKKTISIKEEPEESDDEFYSLPDENDTYQKEAFDDKNNVKNNNIKSVDNSENSTSDNVDFYNDLPIVHNNDKKKENSDFFREDAKEDKFEDFPEGHNYDPEEAAVKKNAQNDAKLYLNKVYDNALKEHRENENNKKEIQENNKNIIQKEQPVKKSLWINAAEKLKSMRNTVVDKASSLLGFNKKDSEQHKEELIGKVDDNEDKKLEIDEMPQEKSNENNNDDKDVLHDAKDGTDNDSQNVQEEFKIANPEAFDSEEPWQEAQNTIKNNRRNNEIDQKEIKPIVNKTLKTKGLSKDDGDITSKKDQKNQKQSLQSKTTDDKDKYIDIQELPFLKEKKEKEGRQKEKQQAEKKLINDFKTKLTEVKNELRRKITNHKDYQAKILTYYNHVCDLLQLDNDQIKKMDQKPIEEFLKEKVPIDLDSLFKNIELLSKEIKDKGIILPEKDHLKEIIQDNIIGGNDKTVQWNKVVPQKKGFFLNSNDDEGIQKHKDSINDHLYKNPMNHEKSAKILNAFYSQRNDVTSTTRSNWILGEK